MLQNLSGEWTSIANFESYRTLGWRKTAKFSMKAMKFYIATSLNSPIIPVEDIFVATTNDLYY